MTDTILLMITNTDTDFPTKSLVITDFLYGMDNELFLDVDACLVFYEKILYFS